MGRSDEFFYRRYCDPENPPKTLDGYLKAAETALQDRIDGIPVEPLYIGGPGTAGSVNYPPRFDYPPDHVVYSTVMTAVLPVLRKLAELLTQGAEQPLDGPLVLPHISARLPDRR